MKSSFLIFSLLDLHDLIFLVFFVNKLKFALIATNLHSLRFFDCKNWFKKFCFLIFNFHKLSIYLDFSFFFFLDLQKFEVNRFIHFLRHTFLDVVFAVS